MSKINEGLHFETKQLHVGQETADPVTDARAVPDLPDNFLCVPRLQPCAGTVWSWRMRATFTAGSRTPRRMYSSGELPL